MADYRFDRGELKRLRLAASLRSEAMAVALDITNGQYLRYESGQVVPSVNRVLQLCSVLGCAPEDLLRPTEVVGS